ncbi:MAG TPA: ABC transporter permease [Gemmatimonadaceae bacterium]|jgi:predicted permease
METLRQDIRYAARGLLKAPGFTLVALLTLALGIGVNSSIFSVVNAILFRPLPVERPDELVDIYGRQSTASEHGTHSYPNYLTYRGATSTLSDLIGHSNFFANLSIEGSSDLVTGELVTDNYFQALGVRPALGRTFAPDEASVIGASAYAVISDRFWKTKFAGAPNVVGQTFRLNGTTYSIIGVAPPEFRGMIPAVTTQMWIPAAMGEKVEPFGNMRVSGRSPGDTRFERRGQHWLQLKGRMKPGVTIAQVRAEFDGLVRRLGEQFPESMGKERIAVVPTSDVRINPDIDATIAPAGLLLVAAVGLVLVVACANLANLMLARAAGRRREIALRAALGAARTRLMRQLLTESLLLALVGGALALPLAVGLSALVSRVRPPLPIDIGLAISPDWRVLVFTLLVAVVTGIVFGLIPALRASRPDLVPALKGASASVGKRLRFELRDALVVVQIAVSLVLVVGGALMVRSVLAAGRVPLGFDGDRTAFVTLALEMNGYDRERGGRFLETGLQRLQLLPQVEAVALTSRLPLSLNNNGFSLHIAGHEQPNNRPFAIDGAFVDERYFTTLRLTILAGRGIMPEDRDQQRRVVVITSTMAQRFWPGQAENALGREFRIREGGEPYQVIGVVADYKVDTPGEAAKSYIHLPLSRRETFGNYVVRTRAAASSVIPALQRELRALDPDLVFLDRGTMRDLADVRLFPVHAGAWLIGAFGVLALLVAAVGLYGVIAYSVSRRVKEIGIRKSLGARPAQLVRMVLGEGMLLVAVGGVIGAGLAAAAARVLSSALFVGPFDTVSFALAFFVLALVALLANALPARRAARVDPMVALRSS